MISFSEEGDSFKSASFNNCIADSIDAGSRLSEAMLMSFMIPFSSSMSRSMSTLPQSKVALFFVRNSLHFPKRYSSLPIF